MEFDSLPTDPDKLEDWALSVLDLFRTSPSIKRRMGELYLTEYDIRHYFLNDFELSWVYQQLLLQDHSLAPDSVETILFAIYCNKMDDFLSFGNSQESIQ